MKILLTGSTGFIGKSVMREAVSRGHEVDTLAENIEHWTGTEKKYDGIIHLAWPRNISPDSSEQLKTIAPHFEFIKLAADCGIKNITVAGTCLEPYNSCYYALAKNSLYDALALIPDIRLKWLRYFYVYGECQRKNSLYGQLIRAIENKDKTFKMSHGQQERDFISVENTASATVNVAEGDLTGIFAIGNGKPQKVIDFVTKIMRNKGHNMRLDTKAYQVPAWEPFSFCAEGIKCPLQ